jgi:RNA polymerase sigma-70 factor (ECF subfamily)
VRCEHGEAQRVIGAAMARLPAWQREVLVLREWQDLSYSEIAEVLAVPVGTVRSRLHKARETLMALLAPAGAGGAAEARA